MKEQSPFYLEADRKANIGINYQLRNAKNGLPIELMGIRQFIQNP